MKAFWKKYTLQFKQASGTSRGVLREKNSWFIFVTNKNGTTGIGECGRLDGLSADDREGYEEKLDFACQSIERTTLWEELLEWPSIQFGVETALLDLTTGGKKILFESSFTQGKQAIPINGLVWMGEEEFMTQQIESKIEQGFRCVKMKIGAIQFDQELKLLQSIREKFSSEEIEIRVDANGAFSLTEVDSKLKQLAELDIHSIEQPIRQGQWKEMSRICANSPLPIALDEELIGVYKKEDKQKLLDQISPPYVIFKPSFIGGIRGTSEWIELCEERKISWWITSALESNIGLNAIAQWCAHLEVGMPQGLGTGQLYTNNFDSPLYVKEGTINFDPTKSWDLKTL